MDVSVSGRHTTVSEKLRQQAVEKIGKLDRYLSGMDRADVHFWEEKNPNKAHQEFCEVTMEGHGFHVRTKVSAPDGFTAIDKAVPKLERQLRKLKTKVINRNHGREKPDVAAELVPDSLLPTGSSSDPVYEIVKTKTFELEQMDAQHAALQMDLLNHDFYLFTNTETSKQAVVYRREDGQVGLIDMS